MHKMSLQQFLKWAFCEELAHVATEGGSLSWARLADFAALGTVIDTSGMGGGLPDIGDVHPDALAANEAVMLLASETFDLPKGWAPFPDMDDPHGLIAACVREVLDRRALRYGGDLNQNLIAMVISYAVMGREPDWTADQPKFSLVMRAGRPLWFVREEQRDAFGRVYAYEADGFDARTGRPKRGAYRKHTMDAGFAGAVQARIDWHLWVMAMEKIGERLGERGDLRLKSHRIAPFVGDHAPWENQAISADSGQVLEKASE